ncbi:hypothetical protein [Aeromonas caviae]|uniref:hypothetical protein n=1 Tax=Aeromonas caviae TaxID=648 RepID=UPI002B463F59|nr:hypothetical protein [Aeromonas caviae]
MHPNITYYVTQQDESVPKTGVSTYVPTLGHPASAIDIYRTVGVHTIENKPASWCFTDLEAASALGRIIDGPIISGSDIEFAESALRSLLLHEYTEILVPCVKVSFQDGHTQYLRLDKKIRNEASFTAFQVANTFDRLLATELVTVSNGKFINSSNNRSPLINTDIELFGEQYPSMLKTIGELAHAFPSQLGATTCFANQLLLDCMHGGAAGFIDEMYNRVYKPWHEIAQSVPSLHLDLKLPPLLAIVLSRASWREKIPEVLKDLREELHQLRSELNRLNKMIDTCMPQAEIISQTKKVNESFDAIVPESLLTTAELRWRRVVSIFNFIRPVQQLYSIAADPLSAEPGKFFDLVQSAKNVVRKDSRIVSRSIPAAKMAELLKIGNIRDSILTHFTEQEVKLIAKC